MKKVICCALILALAALIGGCKVPGDNSAPAVAAQNEKNLPDDQVIAWVNGKPVPKTMLEELLKQIPPYMTDQFKTEEGLKNLAENLIGAELVYQKASAEGFDKKPEVQQKVFQVSKQVIYSEYLQGVLEKELAKPDEAAMKKFYDETPQLADKPFDQVKDQIAEHLGRQGQQQVYEKFIGGLKATAQIKFNDKILASMVPAAPVQIPAEVPPAGGEMIAPPPPEAPKAEAPKTEAPATK